MRDPLTKCGNIPLWLDGKQGSQPEIIKMFIPFPLPMEPLNGLFMAEDMASVHATYKWAPRYRCWMLHSTEVKI